jgi:hypothetical protein
LTVRQFLDVIAQAVQFRDKRVELRQWIAKIRQAFADAGDIDNVILSYYPEAITSETTQTHGDDRY